MPDLASIKPSKSDQPLDAKAGRPSVIDKYPHIVEALKQSFDSKTALQYKVDNAEQAAALERLLRMAGRKLGVGVAIRTDGTTVRFEGRAKRNYTPSSI